MVFWKIGKLIISMHKKRDKKQYNYRGISRLSPPGKVFAKCVEKRCHEIIENKLKVT